MHPTVSLVDLKAFLQQAATCKRKVKPMPKRKKSLQKTCACQLLQGLVRNKRSGNWRIKVVAKPPGCMGSRWHWSC